MDLKFWYLNKGQRHFKGDKEDWDKAALIAKSCPCFDIDDEDELVADEERSCFNCRFRRWTKESFVCMKYCD